jgi:apolipoprotein N-acyltransferase
MRHARLKAVLLTILSAVMMALAQPNEFFTWGSPLLGLFALAPLFVALCLPISPAFTLVVGGAYGFLAHALSSYWLWFFRDFRLWTLGSTSLAYMVVYAGVGAWLALAARASKPWRPLLLALGWVAYEYMKSRGFLAYPWGLLAYSWNTVLPFNQIADITGVFGPSFILAFFNAMAAEAVLESKSLLGPAAEAPARRAWISGMAICAGLFAVTLGYGALRLAQPVQPSKNLRAVIVQPCEDAWSNGSEGARLERLMDLTDAALSASPVPPDMVLWTENTLEAPYDEWAQSYYARLPKTRPLYSYIRQRGIHLFTGAPKVISWKELRAQNAVILIGPDGEVVGHYAKVHPVPFAEAIPFWEYAWMRDFMKKAVGLESGWEIGDRLVLFGLPLAGGGRLRFAAPICFEDAFADLCRDFALQGAEVLVNLTNDSWSKTVSAEIQHLVAARYRSIETRRVLLRSTAAGASCWVDSKGRVRDLLPLFEPASAALEIPVELPDRPTAYMAAGDGFALSVIWIFVISSVILHFKAHPIGRRRESR